MASTTSGTSIHDNSAGQSNVHTNFDDSLLALHLLAGSTSMKALDTAKQLLDSGRYQVNYQEQDWSLTPLHVAANWGNLAMVQLLVHYGADPMIQDDEGNTTFDLTEDVAILKFLEQINSSKPKEKNKILKMVREVFGIKLDKINVLKKKKNKKNRPVSCFAAFEPIKEATKKRRSEQLRRGFKRMTDEELTKVISRISNVNTSGFPVKIDSSNVTQRSTFKKSISNRDFPSNIGKRKDEDAILLNDQLSERFKKLAVKEPREVTKNGGIQQNSAIVDGDKDKRRDKEPIIATAVTNEGEEFEFELSLSSSTSSIDTIPGKERMASIGVSGLTSESFMYPKLQELDEMPVIMPPPRSTSLNPVTPVSRFSKPIPPMRYESVLKTPTAPSEESDVDENEADITIVEVKKEIEILSPLPSTPEVSKEIRALSLTQLRKRLETVGISPGPLHTDNRKIYEKKLVSLEKQKVEVYQGKKHSNALERFMNITDEGRTSKIGLLQEDVIRNEFCVGQVITREKNEISSFCYLLIDPSMIKDQFNCTFREFIEAIFYVGKGKRSRPLQHLIDAAKSNRAESLKGKPVSDKLKRICRLWRKGHGVVSLQLFTNIHPSEALIREAAMIDAFGLKNLTNLKRGEYSGHSSSWTLKEKTEFGVFCLNSAWGIFKHDRCRPVFETDVADAINSPSFYH